MKELRKEGDSSDDSSSDEDKEAADITSKKNKVSMEENKSDIVKTLMGMNSQMRNFSRDVETRLDRVYK